MNRESRPEKDRGGAEMLWRGEDLLELSSILDERLPSFGGETVLMRLARSLLRVRDRSGAEQELAANAVQRVFEQRRGSRNIVLKARQMGMTTWIAGRMFLKTMTRPGTMTVQVAHTREAAEGIFRTVQRFWEMLRVRDKEEVFRPSRQNAGQLRFDAMDSEFRVLGAGSENAGRGLTIQNLHLSEVSRWTGAADLTLAGLRAALVPGGELVLESTPNGAYGCFYNEWQGAEQSGLVRHFFPWWMEPAYVGVPPRGELTPEEGELVKLHQLSREQIGFRRELERNYHGLRAQEFAEDADTCFRTSGDCCFETAAVEERLRVLENSSAPATARDGGTVDVWFPPVPGRRYVVAVDTAGGGAEGDFSVCEVIELETGLQCAELCRRMGTLETAERAARLGREYGTAMIAVERNNHGAGVLAYLHARERYPVLYETAGVAGWPTTAVSKPEMIGRLGSLLTQSPEIFRSPRLLRECRSFVMDAGGRMGAATGAHDDCVMAMAVAHAVRSELLAERRLLKVAARSGMLA